MALFDLNLGGQKWGALGKRVWADIGKDRVFGRSAELAYYFLLALFPLLLFLTSVIGIVIGSGTGLRHSLFNYLAAVLPGSAAELVDSTMFEVSAASGTGKVSFGIIAALWAASNGMGAICDSLNAAYKVEESRPWWKQRITAVGLTIALAFLIIAALILTLYGGHIADWLAASYGLGDTFTIAWTVVEWPLVLLFLLTGFGLIYYWAPDLKDQDWKWVTPGSITAVVVWLAVSFAFRLYLHYFDSYNKTYGSMGAVIVLMLWFFFTGVAILIGGEINSDIEDIAARQGAPQAKKKGKKAP
jgi:membrane protein